MYTAACMTRTKRSFHPAFSAQHACVPCHHASSSVNSNPLVCPPNTRDAFAGMSETARAALGWAQRDSASSDRTVPRFAQSRNASLAKSPIAQCTVGEFRPATRRSASLPPRARRRPQTCRVELRGASHATERSAPRYAGFTNEATAAISASLYCDRTGQSSKGDGAAILNVCRGRPS